MTKTRRHCNLDTHEASESFGCRKKCRNGIPRYRGLCLKKVLSSSSRSSSSSFAKKIKAANTIKRALKKNATDRKMTRKEEIFG
jgi:hypothetical protein